MEKKDKHVISILLVGIGGYGVNYINELTQNDIPGVKIEGICEVMDHVTELFPVVAEKKIPLFRTVEAFYQEHRADLAVISTPIHLHFAQIVTCLENGSNVLSEKPICTTVEEAHKLEELEKSTGHFVAVGYQLNYSKDVLAMKQDILDGKFGSPIMMKAIHGMKRGEKYYQRNRWAGHINVNGKMVNDSPFNNACAHQFQVMTFLLGSDMERAEELEEVLGEVYRANEHLENFDTVAVSAKTKKGVSLYYYTTHAQEEMKIGPISEYHFENAVIYFGKDWGNGPEMEYVVKFEDGSMFSYGEIPKGERLQKLYDAIECTRENRRPVCTVQCAIPHLEAVNELAKLPIIPIREEEIEHVEEDGERFCRIRNLKNIFLTCYQSQLMPSQVTDGWKKKKEEK